MTNIDVNRLPFIKELKYSPLFIGYYKVDSRFPLFLGYYKVDNKSDLVVGEWFLYHSSSDSITVVEKISLNENHDVEGTPFFGYFSSKDQSWLLKEKKERINKYILVLCGHEFEILYLDSNIMCLNTFHGSPVICIKKEKADMFIKGNDDIIGYLSSKENDARNHYSFNLEKITKKAPDFMSYFGVLEVISFILYCAFFYLAVKEQSIIKGLSIVIIIFIISFAISYILTFCRVRRWLKRLFLLLDHGNNPYYKLNKTESDRTFINENRNLNLSMDDYIVVQQEIEKQSIIKIKGNLMAWRRKNINPLNS